VERDELETKVLTVATYADEMAERHIDAYEHGLKKHQMRNWGSYMAYASMADRIRKALRDG
jgi:hypothetical protein